MGKALIQRQTDVEAAANAAFWINVGLGLFMAVLLYADPHAPLRSLSSRTSALRPCCRS